MTTLKSAVLAPIPSAIVVATTAVNSGFRRKARTAYKASRVSTVGPPSDQRACARIRASFARKINQAVIEAVGVEVSFSKWKRRM